MVPYDEVPGYDEKITNDYLRTIIANDENYENEKMNSLELLNGWYGHKKETFFVQEIHWVPFGRWECKDPQVVYRKYKLN